MAHTALHFSVGLAAGTVLPLPAIAKRLARAGRKAGVLGLWLGAAYALALFASVPNILRGLGVPEPICSGWWMNLFLFHPWIDAVEKGGMLVGELLLAACFSLQYLALLLTLRSIQRRASAPQAAS